MITQTRHISNFIEAQEIENKFFKKETINFLESKNIKLKNCDYKKLLEEMKELVLETEPVQNN